MWPCPCLLSSQKIAYEVRFVNYKIFTQTTHCCLLYRLNCNNAESNTPPLFGSKRKTFCKDFLLQATFSQKFYPKNVGNFPKTLWFSSTALAGGCSTAAHCAESHSPPPSNQDNSRNWASQWFQTEQDSIDYFKCLLLEGCKLLKEEWHSWPCSSIAIVAWLWP